jgi:hydroxymethylglutaryl-CoA lyase
MPLLSWSNGNVATEDLLYALRESPYMVKGVKQVALVGQWISEQLGRENASRVGKAILGEAEEREVNG